MSTIISTQFQLPTAVTGNGTTTGNSWSNTGNLLLVDGDVSESSPGIGIASDVTVGNFNPNVPSNATVLGIELVIFAYRGSQTSPAITITPYWVDDTSGTSVRHQYVTPLTGLTQTLASYQLGTPTYLFGTAITPDQANNFKLQLVANGDAYVDAVQVKVFYSVPDPVVPAIGTGGLPIQALPFYLALDFGAGDRYAYLKSFDYVDGTPILYSDLGAAGGVLNLTFDPGLAHNPGGTGNAEENCATASWQSMANGTVRLDFGASLTGRGLQNKSPYQSDSNLISGHNQNAKVIISNNAPFMGQYLQSGGKGTQYSGPVQVEDEGTTLETSVGSLNFTGAGVTSTTDGSGNVTVAISGGAGGASVAAPLLVDAATATVLPNSPAYANGTAGVGATLTAGSNTTLTVDGSVIAAGKLVLVKNQASAFQNGVYVVTTAGSGAAAWKLTRVSNYNTIGQINYSGPVAVLSGTVNALSGWLLTTNTVSAVGTSPISYVSYILGTPVTLNAAQTLTNKRITKRFVSVTASATPTINTDNTDIASIVGLSTAVTSFTANLSGTPGAGDLLMVQITDNGTSQGLSWGSAFASTSTSLPAVTPTGTLLRILFQWDTVSAVWGCLSVV